MSEQPVILVRATAMDGTVARWYRTVADAANQRPILSASRNGVRTHNEYLTAIPDEWIAAAKDAYERLRRDRHTDLTDLATHRHDVVANGPIVPIDRSEG